MAPDLIFSELAQLGGEFFSALTTTTESSCGEVERIGALRRVAGKIQRSVASA